MKVLFINTNDISGGAARAAMRIMRGVQQSGVEAQMFVKDKYSRSSDVIPLSTYAPSSNWLLDIFKWVIQKFKNRYHMFKWHPYKRTKLNVFMSDLRHTDIHGALQKLDYDIVHLHWINNRFLDIRELAKIHKPIVWTLHDSWPFCGVCHYFIDCERYQTHCGACPMLGSKNEQDLAYEIFEKKLEAYKDLDLHIVTPSRWLGDCAKKSALLGRFPVHVIPNCLDTELFRPLAKDEIRVIAEHQQNAVVSRVLREATQEKGLAKPFILYGAMNAANDRRKGFISLLSALQIIDAQGFRANLVVFGAEAQELPMQFKNIDVTFVGYMRDAVVLTALYTIADVMVVPSFSEVFGQTASEAMACGTPVVAFRCTGIQDVVEDGCGYLAEPYSAEDLANGIRYCIEHNPDKVLGKAARESAVSRYAMNVVAEQYKSFYERIKV